MLGKPMLPTEKPRPSWVDQAKERHPEVLAQAAQAIYNTIRKPPLAMIVITMSEEERGKFILTSIHQIYTQMLETEES